MLMQITSLSFMWGAQNREEHFDMGHCKSQHDRKNEK